MIRSSLIKSGNVINYFLKSSSISSRFYNKIWKKNNNIKQSCILLTIKFLFHILSFLAVFKHMTSESSLFGRRSLSSEAMSQFKTLKIVEEKEFVYNVQMNREKKLNALNTVMWL